jgi:hypothetical protein
METRFLGRIAQRTLIWTAFSLFIDFSSAPHCFAEELIRNGNFEKGNRDFRSDYPEGSANESVYLVTKDLRNFHQRQRGNNVGFFGDHTSGKGNMLVADGTASADKAVWAQEVKVVPNADYVFSMWVASWSSDSPAVMEVSINGNELSRIEAPTRLSEWRQLRIKWNSDKDSVASIEIRDRNSDAAGNDFVIDDISLKGPRPLPGKAETRIVQYEKEVQVIREKANAEILTRKQRLIADLNLVLEGLTKEGKLDEAVALREQIKDLATDAESEEGKKNP